MANALSLSSISFISSHAQHGGSERYLQWLLERLDHALVEEVICLENGPFVELLRSQEQRVSVVPVGSRIGFLLGVARLRRHLRRRRGDIVHANGVKAAWAAVMAAGGMDVSVIWVKHDFSWDGWPARMLSRRCAQTVAVSAAVAETLTRSVAGPFRVIPNGIPELHSNRALGRRRMAELLNCSADAPVISLVGRMHSSKGHMELLEAAPLLLRSYPELRIVFIGDEDPSQRSYAEKVHDRVDELGLSRTVSFLGHRPDVITLMSGSDVVALPTVPDDRGMGREGFGLVGVEAMAVGTPVVGYDGGALRETLGDCALLVPPADRIALGEALRQLLDSRMLREQLVSCGYARVRERYGIEKMVESMLACYRDVEAARM